MSVRLSQELETVLVPLDEALVDVAAARGLLAHLGLEVRFPIGGLPAAAARVAEVRRTIRAFQTIPPEEERVADLAPAVEALFDLAETLSDDLSFDAPDEVVADLRSRLPAAIALLPHHLLARYLDTRLPVVATVLRAIGVLDRDTLIPAERFHPDRLVAFLDDPRGTLIDLYDFRSGQDWKASRFLRVLDRLLHELRVRRAWSGPPQGLVDMGLVSRSHPRFEALRYLLLPLVETTTRFERRQGGLVLGPLPASAEGAADGVFVGPFSTLIPGEGDLVLGGWRFEGPVDLAYPAVGVGIRPDGVTLVGSLPSTLRFSIRADEPLVVGDPAAPLITFLSPYMAVELPRSGGDAAFELGTGSPGVRLALDLGAGDALVGKLVGRSLEIELDANLRFTAMGGFELELGSELEAWFVPSPRAGPLSIDAVSVRIRVDTASVEGSVGVDASIRAGLVTFVVGRVGLSAALQYERGRTSWAFVPPTGVGITIGDDGSPVHGGGFLSFDQASRRYSGAIELAFGAVGLTAIGLVDAGGDDWSLVVSLAVDIPPIPLPFGFYIDGIGGLLALNRRFDVDAMRAGLTDGALDALLFPTDPVGQAPLLLRAMERVMPVHPGTIAFGPVMRIRWGVPAIGSLQLGVLVALPEPIQVVLIGQLEVVLPHADAPLVQIRVDLLGDVDLAAGTLAVDAQLHDSWLVGLDLSGSVAIRMCWLHEPAFLVSAGGFHPAFEPPAELPNLRRLMLGLELSDLVEVAAEAYFAVTSNTLQFGGRIDVVANLKVARVTGGMGLDVLVQRSPFGFDASAHFYASVEAVGITLAAVRFEGRLQGPRPWSIDGYALVKIAGVPTEVEIRAVLPKNVPREEISTETVDVGEEIRAALVDPRCWRPASAGAAGISLRSGLGDDAIAPDASVEVVQGIAPLGIRLDRYGEFEPRSPGPFDLDAPTLGDAAGERVEAIRDWFAPASFTDVDDEARLAAPSFERFSAGIRFGASSALAQIGEGRDMATDYEELLWDPDLDPDVRSDPSSHEPAPTPAVAVSSWRPLSLATPTYALKDATTGEVLSAGLATAAAARQRSHPGAVVVPEVAS